MAKNVLGSSTSYTGDAVTSLFSISFALGIINVDQIKVYLDDVLKTNITDYIIINNASQVQFTTAPDSGVTIDIRREQDDNSVEVDYQDTKQIKEKNLDDSNKALYYLLHELFDGWLGNRFKLRKNLNANNHQINNIQNATDPQDVPSYQQVLDIVNGGTVTVTTQEYDSVADMVLTSLSDGTLANTRGYYSANSEGAGTYLIMTASAFLTQFGVTADELGHHTLANGNVAALIVNGVVDLYAYGAKLDGVTDDSASIAAAHVLYDNVSIDGNILSDTPYATFGSDVVVDPTTMIHVAGTEEILNATIALEANTYYRITVNITTTTSGNVKILFGNDTVAVNQSEIIFGDQTGGFLFSTETILLDGTENNRIMVDNVYYYSLYTSTSGYTNLHLQTDTSWAGTISSVVIEEVSENTAALKIISNDGVDRDFYTGIKVGGVNRDDYAIGDKSSLGMFIYDGISPTPAHNIAYGARTLATNQHGDENTALGSFALQGNEGSDNVAVGYSALKINNKGQENTAVGYKAGTTNSTGFRNCFFGFWSGVYTRTGRDNCHYGWRANILGGDNSFNSFFGSKAGSGILTGDANVVIGNNAGTVASQQAELLVDSVVAVGSDSKPYGNNTVVIGAQSRAGTEGTYATGAVAVGKGANAKTDKALAVGFTAVADTIGSVAIGNLANAVGDLSIAIGDNSTAGGQLSTALGEGSSAGGERSVAVGQDSSSGGVRSTVIGGLANPTGDYVTSLGFRAGASNTGTYNTNIGWQAAFNANAYTNTSCLGAATSVTGSNQVQLGDSATTTYAYGAVQNRSDIRDKTDILDLTDAHIAFFMDVEWKQFKFNYRESYIEILDDGTTIEHENDGSNTGSRYHIGAIAQQVEEAMNKHGIDFAGLQHHSYDGVGEDIYSIGYEEFIGIQGEIIQRQQSTLNSILNRLDSAGI